MALGLLNFEEVVLSSISHYFFFLFSWYWYLQKLFDTTNSDSSIPHYWVLNYLYAWAECYGLLSLNCDRLQAFPVT